MLDIAYGAPKEQLVVFPGEVVELMLQAKAKPFRGLEIFLGTQPLELDGQATSTVTLRPKSEAVLGLEAQRIGPTSEAKIGTAQNANTSQLLGVTIEC